MDVDVDVDVWFPDTIAMTILRATKRGLGSTDHPPARLYCHTPHVGGMFGTFRAPISVTPRGHLRYLVLTDPSEGVPARARSQPAAVKRGGTPFRGRRELLNARPRRFPVYPHFCGRVGLGHLFGYYYC